MQELSQTLAQAKYLQISGDFSSEINNFLSTLLTINHKHRLPASSILELDLTNRVFKFLKTFFPTHYKTIIIDESGIKGKVSITPQIEYNEDLEKLKYFIEKNKFLEKKNLKKNLKKNNFNSKSHYGVSGRQSKAGKSFNYDGCDRDWNEFNDDHLKILKNEKDKMKLHFEKKRQRIKKLVEQKSLVELERDIKDKERQLWVRRPDIRSFLEYPKSNFKNFKKKIIYNLNHSKNRSKSFTDRQQPLPLDDLTNNPKITRLQNKIKENLNKNKNKEKNSLKILKGIEKIKNSLKLEKINKFKISSNSKKYDYLFKRDHDFSKEFDFESDLKSIRNEKINKIVVEPKIRFFFFL